MKIKITKRKEYLRIEKILKKEFIIRTIIFFLIALYFFINSFKKYRILTVGDVDILLSSYIFILFKIYIKM